MERCTHCRARLTPGQESCQRCGMELGRLRQVLAEAALLDQRAASAMLDGDMEQAERLLEQRLRLRRDTFIEDLLAFVRTRHMDDDRESWRACQPVGQASA